jgi:hypothetical protein
LDCHFCGFFQVTGTDAALVGRHVTSDLKLRAALAAHIRQANERGEKPVVVSADNWRDHAEGHRHTPVVRKLSMVLEYLGNRSEHPGAEVALKRLQLDYPLFDAQGIAESKYLVQTLNDLDYIHSESGEKCVVTATGWGELNPSGGRPGTCFVAMAFNNDEIDAAYDQGIARAIADCGFVPVRVDREPYNDSITDKIIVGIRSAQFVIADVTKQRNGVYFEGGYAMGLGRPVIWMVHKKDMDAKRVHFDTSHLNHIVWSDPTDLRSKLTDRIRATIPGARLS